jgi:cell division inhibitor SulA
MPKYVIERDLPGAGDLTSEDSRAISQTSDEVLAHLGSQIRWLTSYVTDDKIYCVYVAPGAAIIEEHARRGGLPVTRISKVSSVIDP